VYLYLDRFRLWLSGKTHAHENAYAFASSRGGHIASDRG
jgi:hypothetical protein